MNAITSLYYFRLMALDQPGVLSQISGILGRYRISIAQMIQRGRKQGWPVPSRDHDSYGSGAGYSTRLGRNSCLSCVTEEPVLIRVEGRKQ